MRGAYLRRKYSWRAAPVCVCVEGGGGAWSHRPGGPWNDSVISIVHELVRADTPTNEALNPLQPAAQPKNFLQKLSIK